LRGYRRPRHYTPPTALGNQAYVLDTTALLAGLQLSLPRSYTTSQAVEEVRDHVNREKVRLAITIGRLETLDPGPRSVKEVVKAAQRIGEGQSLSNTDISIAALALDLLRKGMKPVVVTDDYSLQNLLTHLGVEYKPLRTRGIQRPRRYKLVCPACGYRARGNETYCPRCGSKLKRIPV